MTLLLLHGVDPDHPCLLGALFPGGLPSGRPGLRLAPAPHLASWDRESGRGWVGLGPSGLAAGLLLGPRALSSPLPDLLARALSGADPAGAAQAVLEGWGEARMSSGWLLVAGLQKAWLVAGGRTAARELPAGVHLVASEGLLSSPWPGQEELALPAPSAPARRAAIQAFLDGPSPGAASASAAAVVAPAGPGSAPGLFLFRPGLPGAAAWLDYSNLIRRLGN